MPKIITIDSAQVLQIRLSKDQTGNVHVYCEYLLKAGTQAIETKAAEITANLNANQQTAASGLVDAIAQAIANAEGI